MALKDFLQQQQNINVPEKDSSLSSFMEGQRGRQVGMESQSNSLSNFLQRDTAPIEEETRTTTPTTIIEPDQEKTESSIMDTFRWIGKQLSKPSGIVASEIKGAGNIIGSLMAIASPKVDAEKGIKSAAKSFLQAQKDSWNVLRGEKETSFSEVLNEAIEGSGRERTALDKVMGVGGNFVIDPLEIFFKYGSL